MLGKLFSDHALVLPTKLLKLRAVMPWTILQHSNAVQDTHHFHASHFHMRTRTIMSVARKIDNAVMIPALVFPDDLVSKDRNMWRPVDVWRFLKANKEEYFLHDGAIDVLRQNEVSGRIFLTLTGSKLRKPPFDFSYGVAMTMGKLIEAVDKPQVAIHPSDTRRNRWHDLKATTTTNGNTSTRYHWEDVMALYEPITNRTTIEPKQNPRDDLEGLHQYLSKLSRGFGSITTGKEAKFSHFVVPILIHISDLFDGDIRILVEPSMSGKSVNVDVNGHLDFIIERKQKKICIVLAKSDNNEQDMAQALLGCEAVADAESLGCVYGIVTNYLEWVFLKSLDGCIEQDETTLAVESGVATKDGLQLIVGKIYALLSD